MKINRQMIRIRMSQSKQLKLDLCFCYRMLNRRHLRIKILHVLYAFYQDEERDVVKTKKALDHSIDKMQELYLLLLLMIGSLQSFAIDRIEAGRKKQLPNPEDLHPNTKFVTNRPLRVLAKQQKLEQSRCRWQHWMGQ